MRYSPDTYARALVLVLREEKISHREAVERLLAVLKRNGDLPRLRKVVDGAERMMLKESGSRKVGVASARPLEEKMFKKLRAAFGEKDVVETSVDPKLIAGVRLTFDGEWMIDASLSGRLKKLFR